MAESAPEVHRQGRPQRRPELDRELHLGHRGRRAARRVRARQVPRRDPADDRTPSPGRRARRHPAGGRRHEGGFGRGGNRGAGPRAPTGERACLLQHVRVRHARSDRPRNAPAAHRGLRRLPRRVLAERAGHPRQLRVPQPDTAARQGRRARRDDREARVAGDQSRPGTRHAPGRDGEARRARQPRHGVDLRGAGAPVQRGEQRGGGRALDAPRRGEAHGEARVPARRGRDPIRHVPAVRRRVRHGGHADRRGRDPGRTGGGAR